MGCRVVGKRRYTSVKPPRSSALPTLERVDPASGNLLGRTVFRPFLPATNHPVVGFRIVPCRRDAHPALDGHLQLGTFGLELEVLEAVDDFLHELSQLGVIDARDIRPRDVPAVSVHYEDIRIIAGAGDRAQSGMPLLDQRVAHVRHDHDPRQLCGDGLFVVPVLDRLPFSIFDLKGSDLIVNDQMIEKDHDI